MVPEGDRVSHSRELLNKRRHMYALPLIRRGRVPVAAVMNHLQEAVRVGRFHQP